MSQSTRQGDAWAPINQSGGKGLTIGPTEGLGRTYVLMVLAALAVISIDQTVVRTLTSTARIVLDAAIGAAVGLAVLKLLDFTRRWQ
jgi:hypothetical protein